MNNIVIVEGKRTPIGNFLGGLSSFSSVELATHTVNAIVGNTLSYVNMIQNIIVGCVLSAGLKQAPARQVVINSLLNNNTGAFTVNKVCGSGMQSIILAAQQLSTNPMTCILAGGMESMSQAPYLLKNMRKGKKFDSDTCYDHMLLDGLEDAYTQKSMTFFAELHAHCLGYSREKLDEFATKSLIKAKYAVENNCFASEIVEIKKETQCCLKQDELPVKAKIEKISTLPPILSKTGVITAANASAISDGAAMCLMTSKENAIYHNLPIQATILGWSEFVDKPENFITAPVDAIKKLLHQLSWQVSDVDLWEVNEAFAVVPLYVIEELNIDSNKINVFGGACALGHPIGCSGSRIVITLMNALQYYGKKRGIATVCIGGGEALAIAIEV